MFSATKLFLLAPALAALSLLAQTPASDPETTPAETNSLPDSDLNVNSRYTIESITFNDHREYKLSTSALDQIRRLIGAKATSEALDSLTARIRDELRAHAVTFKLAQGGRSLPTLVLDVNVRSQAPS